MIYDLYIRLVQSCIINHNESIVSLCSIRHELVADDWSIKLIILNKMYYTANNLKLFFPKTFHIFYNICENIIS